TFKNKEGITFPSNVGGKRTVTSDQVEFVGYGLNAPLANHNDYAGKNVKGKTVVFLGSNGPKGLQARPGRWRPRSRAGSPNTNSTDSPRTNSGPGCGTGASQRRRWQSVWSNRR